MSGGFFDYKQYQIQDIINDIEQLYENAVFALKVDQIYTHRIDWFESGDDGEDTFIGRLYEELNKLRKRYADV